MPYVILVHIAKCFFHAIEVQNGYQIFLFRSGIRVDRSSTVRSWLYHMVCYSSYGLRNTVRYCHLLVSYCCLNVAL